MMFVLRMSWRETRASWRRLLFFFVCVAIGVGAIVALRSVIQSVRHAFSGQARNLMGADVLIQTSRGWDEQTLALIADRLRAAQVLDRTEAVEMATMVRPADEQKVATKMVELRAVEPAFPFYGTFGLEGGVPYTHSLLEGRGVLVRPELLTQLDVKVGDAIVIGKQAFTVRGVILDEPGRSLGSFSFGSRVLIDLTDLRGTGLVAFGSRVNSQILLRVAEPAVDPLVRTLRTDLGDRFVTARSYRNAENRVGTNFDRAENYMSLVGLVIVILGGIGVWSVTRVFIQQKIKSIAILKCVGSNTRQILATYLLQTVLLGLAGSLFGVVLAWAGIAAIPSGITALVAGVSYGLTASAVVQGVGIGVVVSLLFAVAPLLEIRHVKPIYLLRQEAVRSVRMAPGGVSGERSLRQRIVDRVAETDWLRVAVMGAAFVVLVGLTAWQAASPRIGLYVLLGFTFVAIALHLAGLALVRCVRPLVRSTWFPLRHAVLSLNRPGNQTRVILLVVGLGSFLILGVRGLQTSLLRELAVQLRENAPDMFMIDIQEDQADGVREYTASASPDGAPRLIPVLRARVTGIKGREVNLDRFDDTRGRGSIGREYVITYRGSIEPNESILEGRFWDGSSSTEPEVSIEESIRDRFNVRVGDSMRFDVLGRVIGARVTSVRKVNWSDSRNGGFMFVFRPGALESAPHTYIATLKGPAETAARARFQRDLVARFPNVSVIDGREIMRTVTAVMESVSIAISTVGAITLLSGVLILVGSVAMTKFQRLYESAILKTLGAASPTLMTMLVLEYSTLGAIAGVIGSTGGIILSWVITERLLEVSWRPAFAENIAGIALTAVAVAAVGVFSSLDVIRRKPMSILRAE